ncbi:unnamed protein product [Pseudo-nitzschia multistriata]|uniref:Uncharacterized protein n=1 Tax=Pseudo-nitzschia multistriata TaxID=183589 RepID=A0A448Z254_9STRA|nr:unnamed protein product [Pseudo-nitzschia multistriata]
MKTASRLPLTPDILKIHLRIKEEQVMLAKKKELERNDAIVNMMNAPASALHSLLLEKERNDSLRDLSKLSPSNTPYRATAIPVAGQKRALEMTRTSPSSDLLTALHKKNKIANFTRGSVQRRDSGITSFLRGPKEKRLSSQNALELLRDVGMIDLSHSEHSLKEAIGSRLLRSASRDSPHSSHPLSGVSTQLPVPHDIDSIRLSNLIHSSPAPCNHPEASNLLRMLSKLEEEEEKNQLIATHLNQCNIVATNPNIYGMDIVDNRVKKILSTLQNPLETSTALKNGALFNLQDKLRLKQIEQQLFLNRLEREREDKALRLAIAERRQRSALLLQQQEAAAILTDQKRQQTLNALLALRSQRAPLL